MPKPAVGEKTDMSLGSPVQSVVLFAMVLLVSYSGEMTDIKDNECTDSHFC